MIVVEELTPCTEDVLKKLLARIETGRLVYPGRERLKEKFGDRIKETIRLSGGFECSEGREGGQCSEGSGGSEGELFFTAVGWNFRIKSCGGEKLMMLHCLAENTPGESKRVSGGTAADSEKTGNLFEECVMDVKGMDGWQKCTETSEPDGYECALGCVLHCDYDVCSYRSRAGANSGLTGTILLPELSPEGFSRTVSGLGRNSLEKVRFFVTGQPDLILQSPRILPRGRAERRNRKRYYIGAEQDFPSGAAGELCRGGIYQVPVLLEERAGLCCSGFLKYRAASLK